MGVKDWFECWFGEEYKRLYPHRDGAQAAAQVDALIRAAAHAGNSPAARDILDIGCGAGRHLAAFRHAFSKTVVPGARIVGIDLSAVLLRDARADGLAVARADMRRLPFADGRFDLVACFFTSFGYFHTPAEDAAALAEFARVTRPGGLLFLDLPNRKTTLGGLVSAESVEHAASPGRRVEITRALEDDRVIKRIRIVHGEPGAAEREELHEERVRLYSLSTLAPMLDDLALETAAVLGDERGAPFDAESSPRMSLLLRRAA
jgi:SAM-dependent methyltransferase